MPHIIAFTEEIEERGFCQQRPVLETGDKYLFDVEGEKRLRIVRSVHFDRYVWEDVAQWTTTIEEFLEEEYTLCTMSVGAAHIPVFVAKGLIGVLSCDKDAVQGELVIPASIGDVSVRGVAPFGFCKCERLTKVTISPMVLDIHEHAFERSGLKDMTFNDVVPVIIHITAVDGCASLPKFEKLFDHPFPGKYLFRGGDAFEEWIDKT